MGFTHPEIFRTQNNVWHMEAQLLVMFLILSQKKWWPGHRRQTVEDPFLGPLRLFHVSNCNCSLLSNVCVVTGVVVIHGYIYAVQLGRVAAAGFCAETPVPGCDSGKL